MPLELYLNTAASGVLTGSIYALLALGLTIIFGVIHIVNFAHGELLVIGIYATFFLFEVAGLDPFVALPLVGALLFGLGYFMQKYLIDAFVTRPDYQQFLLLIAVAMILTNGTLMMFGPEARSVMVDYSFDSFEVGPLLLDKVKVYGAFVAMALSAGLWVFFRKTRVGKAIRACSDNHTGAQVVGLNVKKLYGLTFGLGAAIAGIAGGLLVILIPATPHSGADFTLLAFIIVIVGGMGSVAGALVGGILIGLSEAMAGLLIDPALKQSFSFALLIAVLMLRPQGLLVRRAKS